mmetsp:Transcript_5355/g.15301  ORF Transcript_5355/g.15301 Transcript_5355/m.15301 type:complete len:414 (-) Transcript_5355:339-1580(-)
MEFLLTPRRAESESTRALPAPTKVERETLCQDVAFLRFKPDASVAHRRLIRLDSDETTFGRHSSCDVVLDSERMPKMISRLHGCLQRRREAGRATIWTLVDNNSVNGILVNGIRVEACGRIIQQGDEITFGRQVYPHEFRFVFELRQPPLSGLLSEHSADDELFDWLSQDEGEADRDAVRLASSHCQPCVRQGAQLDMADLQSELVCSICHDWLVHAANIECSHTFCWSCIDTWLLHKKFECPLCRNPVTRQPLQTRALDAIVQKAVDQLPAPEKVEYAQRVVSADKAAEKCRRQLVALEASVNDALLRGKVFLRIDARWSVRERQAFASGVKDYSGETRETYCRLTGLTVQWVHSSDETKLRQAIENLQLPDLQLSSEDGADTDRTPLPSGAVRTSSLSEIRQRLLMFLHYG